MSDVAALRACIAAGVAGSVLIALALGSLASFGGLVLLGLALLVAHEALVRSSPEPLV